MPPPAGERPRERKTTPTCRTTAAPASRAGAPGCTARLRPPGVATGTGTGTAGTTVSGTAVGVTVVAAAAAVVEQGTATGVTVSPTTGAGEGTAGTTTAASQPVAEEAATPREED